MMIPTVSTSVAPPSVTTQSAPKPALPQQAEAPRTSAGETSAANLRGAIPQAIDPADQSTVAPRLRDQETAEKTERKAANKDAPAGPPPAFEETLLARQARIALDPTETPVQDPSQKVKDQEDRPDDPETLKTRTTPPAPPPTPTERAETGFAQTKSIATPAMPSTLDLSA